MKHSLTHEATVLIGLYYISFQNFPTSAANKTKQQQAVAGDTVVLFLQGSLCSLSLTMSACLASILLNSITISLACRNMNKTPKPPCQTSGAQSIDPLHGFKVGGMP